VFADKELEEDVMKAGADFFGTDELLKKLAAGETNFDKIIATPE
jgi:ribosomal protein L1